MLLLDLIMRNQQYNIQCEQYGVLTRFASDSVLCLTVVYYPQKILWFHLFHLLLYDNINVIVMKYEDRIQHAVENFMHGYGCAQSVVGAFADLYGFTDIQAKQIAAGFGGGVGRLRMMCGAVSGMVILAGMDCGQTDGADHAGKTECYKVVQSLLAKFMERNGSVICAELLGLKGPIDKTPEASERNSEYYKVRPCAAKVESAARIFAEYLDGKG